MNLNDVDGPIELPQEIADEQDVGQAVSRQGNGFTQLVGRASLGLFGWKIQGQLPNLSKFIIVGAPHTSNWDWLVVIATAWSLKVRISWMAKDSFFQWPFKNFLKRLGGLPINRRAAHGVVAQNVEAFKKRSHLILCITPEGTRSRVRRWKQGFYHIALGANVPILLASFDYGRKVVGLGPLVTPSGDYEADLAKIQAFYGQVTPRHPHNYKTTE